MCNQFLTQFYVLLDCHANTMLIPYLLITAVVYQACLATPVDFELKPAVAKCSDVKGNRFAYHVSIQWRITSIAPFRHICGGSLLKKNYVLTAAHCVLKFGEYKIVVGKHDLHKVESTEQYSGVKRSIIHEQYKKGKEVAQYDIALLELTNPLHIKDMNYVNLPRQNAKHTGIVMLSGWGTIFRTWFPWNPAPLQKTTVSILDNTSCRTKFNALKSKLGIEPKIYDTQICTDSIDNAPLCGGDSGGPLVQFSGRTPLQVGIVTWSTTNSLSKLSGVPTVYTHISSFTRWIKKNSK